jgi:DNA-binding NarL/FixJ family response regulator
MPRCESIEATRRLREYDASIKVLVLTTYTDDRSVIDALRAGPRGCLTKDAGAAEIRRALEQVTHGQPAIDPAVQQHLLGSRPPAHRQGSLFRLRRSLDCFPDREHLVRAEDFQHPGKRSLRMQQHQVAAALPQAPGGNQEHPDSRRVREIQPGHVNGQLPCLVG